MKNIILTIVVSLASTFVMAFTSSIRTEVSVAIELEPERPLAFIISPPIVPETIIVPIFKTHSDFLNDLGYRESTNNYKAVNQFGYLGKYQFGRRTLNALGYKNVTNRQFLSNASIQEEAMYSLLIHNKRILRRTINKYSNKTINGIYITEAGILAAAHLAGAGNVKRFFRKGYEFRDGNGTKMTSYMLKFNMYRLEL
tara:strand:+ start:168 stop:761 length:594 start_codon:yes stop_codon:yes gene_type:complete